MKIAVRLCLLSFAFLFIYYFYVGFHTKPYGGDSVDYHIPIAKTILSGDFLTLPNPPSPLLYYPGSSNAILSLFILLNIPLNLFGWFSWIILFFLARRFAVHFGLRKDVSWVFALAACSFPSIIRQMTTQSIDIWMSIFFLWSILLLESPQKRILYFIKLGVGLGMLIGSKYSGVFYIFVLIVLYHRVLLQVAKDRRVILSILPFFFCGVFWYARNYILTANPFYPANLPFFPGSLGFLEQSRPLWKTPFFYHEGTAVILEALISEYLVWMLSVPIVGIFLILQFKKKIALPPLSKKILFLGAVTFLVSLQLPIPPINIISNMRYLFNLMIPSILFTFLMAQRYRRTDWITSITLINFVMMIPQLDYYPKLFFAATVCLGIGLLLFDIKRSKTHV